MIHTHSKIRANEHFLTPQLSSNVFKYWKGVIHLTPVFITQCVVPLFDTEGLWYQPRVLFQYRDCLSICKIPILKITQSWDRIIYILGIPTSVRQNAYVETTPRFSLIYIPLWLGVFVYLKFCIVSHVLYIDCVGQGTVNCEYRCICWHVKFYLYVLYTICDGQAERISL